MMKLKKWLKSEKSGEPKDIYWCRLCYWL